MSESEISTAETLDVLFEWIDEDPEVRAALCASMIPVTLGDFEAARQILIKYGTIDNVQKTLGFGFNSESYHGSTAEHYEKKKAEFELLKSQESHRVVRQWLDSHISHLDFMIRGFGMLKERDEI